MIFCLGCHVKKSHVLECLKQVERGGDRGKVYVGTRETDR